jgi:hypothetical protein
MRLGSITIIIIIITIMSLRPKEARRSQAPNRARPAALQPRAHERK